jgi:hypothetical protein
VAQAVPPTTINSEGKSRKAPKPTPMLIEMIRRLTDEKIPIIVAMSMGVHPRALKVKTKFLKKGQIRLKKSLKEVISKKCARI